MTEGPTPGMIQPLTEPVTAWARSHHEIFLSDAEPWREQIERHLLMGARAVGASDAVLIRFGHWSVVGASRDWFAGRRVPLVDDDEAFNQMRAFPELGVNSCQGEFVVGAFAEAALVLDELGVRVVKGDDAPEAAFVDFMSRHPQWRRAVAFTMTAC
jgi:hypothetical protein